MAGSKASTHRTAAALVTIMFAAGALGPARAELVFTEVTGPAGIAFQHESGTFAPIGAGAAWVDIDADGDDDLYAVQATGCNRLYLNLGNGSFAEVPMAAGAADCNSESHGVTAADYDNDGDQDLFISNNGQNRLFKNLLAETATLELADVTAQAGMNDDGAYNSASATWGDYDGDGDLDLFVTNHYVTKVPIECFPDYLWRNEGDGTFTDVGDATGIALSGVLVKAACGLAGTWSDYDNDGDADLLVINDFAHNNFVPNRLFRNDGSDGQGGWLFADVSEPSGFDFAQAGMGIAIGDINRDGHFDYYSSDIGPNELAFNLGNGTFMNNAHYLQVTADDEDIYGGRGLVSWGVGFFDLDHDGREDLVVANGGAPQFKFPGFFNGRDYVQQNPNYVYLNAWASPFPEVHSTVGITAEKFHRSAVFGDYDGDGDIDIYFGNLQGTNTLYRNDLSGNGRNWLEVKVRGTLSNRDGIGTRLRVKTPNATQMREIDGGSTFVSRNTLTAHFGLGSTAKVDLFATFPGGIEHEMLKVPVNQLVALVEPLLETRLSPEFSTIVAGETASLELRVTNHSGESITQNVWIVKVAPNGSTNVLSGPFSPSLGPGQTFTRMINLPTTPQTLLGKHTVISRTGTFPGTTTQQDHADVEVVAPVSAGTE